MTAVQIILQTNSPSQGPACSLTPQERPSIHPSLSLPLLVFTRLIPLSSTSLPFTPLSCVSSHPKLGTGFVASPFAEPFKRPQTTPSCRQHPHKSTHKRRTNRKKSIFGRLSRFKGTNTRFQRRRPPSPLPMHNSARPHTPTEFNTHPCRA